MAAPDLVELRQNIYSAIEEMGSEASLQLLGKLAGQAPSYYKSHLEMEHSVPSPSSLATCRLQQWYKAKGEVTSRAIPAAWQKRSAAGVLTEMYWLAILEIAGLSIYLPNKAVKCGPNMRAHPDGYIGDDGHLELKDKTGWGYKRLMEGRGVAFEEPREYTQSQLYLHATGRDWLLYFASPADPALLQSLMRQWKKYGRDYELPLFYLEVVDKYGPHIEASLIRADMIVDDITKDEHPPREFEGLEFDNKGNRTFQCGYCVYVDSCRRDYSERPE